MRGPLRSPLRDCSQLRRASARAWHPDVYASFEFSGHHGVPSSRIATVCLRWFHSRRSAITDQPSTGVSSSPARP